MEIIAGDFGLEWKRKDGEIHKADYEVEVIGNIFDNPGLLEAE